MSKEYEFHPAAGFFPMMEGEAYEKLKQDIAKHGLRQPIILCEGKILDGRNRYRVCRELGIEAKTHRYSGKSPTAYVWSLNGERRQLSKGQLADVMVEMLPQLEAEAKARMSAGGKRGGVEGGRGNKKTPAPVPAHPFEPAEIATKSVSSSRSSRAIEEAVKIVGGRVGHTTVQIMKRIARERPDLRAKIRSNSMTVEAAYREMTGHKSGGSRPKPNKQARPIRIADIQRLAAEGYRAEQIAGQIGLGVETVRKMAKEEKIVLPDARIGKTRAIDAHRIITETINGLAGYAMGLQLINGSLKDSVSSDEAREWIDSLTKSMKPISRLRTQLKEIIR